MNIQVQWWETTEIYTFGDGREISAGFPLSPSDNGEAWTFSAHTSSGISCAVLPRSDTFALAAPKVCRKLGVLVCVIEKFGKFGLIGREDNGRFVWMEIENLRMVPS